MKHPLVNLQEDDQKLCIKGFLFFSKNIEQLLVAKVTIKNIL